MKYQWWRIRIQFHAVSFHSGTYYSLRDVIIARGAVEKMVTGGTVAIQEYREVEPQVYEWVDLIE